MGIVFRQSIKTTIVTFSGAMLGAALLYISTQYLPQQAYGFQKDITFKAVVFSNLVLLGLHTTLYNFILKYPAGDKRRPVLITLSLAGPIVMSAVCMLPYFLLKDYITSLYQPQDRAIISRFYYWLPVFTIFWSYMTLLEQYLTSQMKVAMSLFYREILVRLFNVVWVVLYALNIINFQNFIIWGILAHAIPIACLYYHATKTEGFGISLKTRGVFSKAEYKELGYYAWYHILLNVSASLLGYMDSMMLASIDTSGMKSLAVYSTAVFIISFMQIPYRSMISATMPVITRAFHENDQHKVADLFKRSAINMLLVSVTMGIIICCNMHNAIAIIGNEYAAVAPLVFIFLIGRLVDVLSGMNTEILSISVFYKYNFYISILLLALIIILNKIFIPIWGIFGAAWATTLALGIYNIVKYFFVLTKLKLQPISVNSWKILLAGAVALGIGFYTPRIANPFADTIIRTAIIVVILLVLFITLKVSEDMTGYLQTVKKNKRLF